MRRLVDLLLDHWLQADSLAARPRHADQDRAAWGQVLDLAERLAADRFAPFNRLVDDEEPRMDAQGRVVLPQATQDAWNTYAASGLLAATQDAEWGGLQLPHVVATAARLFFSKASVSIHAGMLTVGNANLLLAHGSPAQQQAFVGRELAGEWSGTMALSEPQAGSGLADITTRALPDADVPQDALGVRYRLHGTKMWISTGDHELTPNIVHLVLAKIPNQDGTLPAGVKGISLFVCPKFLVDERGEPTGERNDVVLAGLNHKLGWRGTTNTLLNFGEGAHRPGGKAGAVAWRVGEAGQGLACMFHMMNEARIAIGGAAAMIAMAGYEVALGYARERRQGRRLGAKDTGQPPVPIIEHVDVRRMLLEQKVIAEGSLAMVLFGARLVDDAKTGTPDEAARANRLLDVLTPVIKSWPSEWGLHANSQAIQVLGGAGYTRDFPVEQLWRDQRLNMIHEGTHGIQALDLLGRKVLQRGGADFAEVLTLWKATIERARGSADAELAAHADALQGAVEALRRATRAAWEDPADPERALANATPYMQAFGHVMLAWVWLDVVLALSKAGTAVPTEMLAGLRQACRFMIVHELPKVGPWLELVRQRDATALAMHDAWF